MSLKSIIPLVWIAAFLCSLFFFNNLQLELFGAAFVLVSIWSVIMASRNRMWQVPKSWVVKSMAAFWFVAFISIFHSDIFNISLMAFCFFSVMPLTFFIFVIYGDKREFELVGKILACVLAGLSIWALLQFFVYSDYFGGRARHPLTNPNSLGALFSLGFFCSIGWMLVAKQKIYSNAALIISVLIFCGLVATGSRGALFAMIPVLILFLSMMRVEVRKHYKCFSILFVLCAVFFCASSLGGMQNDSLMARVGDSVSMNLNDFTSNRLSLWEASVAMIKAHGLWGTGIGTYFQYFPEFRLADDAWGTYYAHSDPLQYWVELGVLGPFLFYGFIIAVIGRTVLALRSTEDVMQRILILAPFCALGACIIHTHVTFNLYNLSILLSVGFLLSVWFWATQAVLKTSTHEISFSHKYSFPSRIVIVALPFLMIGGLFMAFIVSEHYTNKARDHLLSGEFEEFADDVILANQISMGGNYRSYLLAVNVPLTLLQEAGDQLSEAQKKEIFDQGLSYLRHVRDINPRSSSALYYLAKIQQVGTSDLIPEDLESPEAYYMQALSIDPLHLGARMELSYIYEKNGQKTQALDILEGGFDFKYSSAKAMEFYGRIAQLYILDKNILGRDEALRKMRSFKARLERAENKKSKSMSEHLWGEQS